MRRRELIIAAIAAALGAVPASQLVMADTQKVKPPKTKKITPSDAARRAQTPHPGSTVLDVKDTGNQYIVTLKTPGELKRVAIPYSP